MKWTLPASIFALFMLAAPTLASAQSDESADGSLQYEAEPDIYFDEYTFLTDPTDWRRKFDVVIVINKNRELLNLDLTSGNETIDIYRFGQLALRSFVSSGRETPELHDENNKESPKTSYFSQTPTGYYTIRQLDIDHVSNQWEDAFMPWSMFFNGGIATHRSPHEDLSPGGVGRDPFIGYRHSGGCVRLHEQVAKRIFWWVRASGAPYTDAEMSNCHFQQEAAQEMAVGNFPRQSKEEVLGPKFDVNGAFISDNMIHHYNALVIVENRPLMEGPRVLADRGKRYHAFKKQADGSLLFLAGNKFADYQLPSALSGEKPWVNPPENFEMRLGQALVHLNPAVDLTWRDQDEYYVAPLFHEADLELGNIPQCTYDKLAADRAARDGAVTQEPIDLLQQGGVKLHLGFNIDPPTPPANVGDVPVGTVKGPKKKHHNVICMLWPDKPECQ